MKWENLKIKARIKRYRKGICTVIFIAVSEILLLTSQRYPAFADWYSKYIYRALVWTVGRVMWYFPFSVSEVLLYILIAGFLCRLIWLIVGTVRKKKKKKEWKRFGKNLLFAASVFLLSFTLCCGINYKKTSFTKEEKMISTGYTEKQLKYVCTLLTNEIYRLANLLERSEEGTILLGDHIEAQAVLAMKEAGETYEGLKGFYPEPKRLICPELLSIQKLTGVYSPFTIEANYNQAIPEWEKPFTMCHELSHLRGYMQEEESNFIGFVACRHSQNAAFRYSGYLSAWDRVANELRKQDYAAYEKLYNRLPEGAKKDLVVSKKFWSKYDGGVAEVANRVNDTYLKANGQQDGVQSYGKMVDLVMGYYLQKGDTYED